LNEENGLRTTAVCAYAGIPARFRRPCGNKKDPCTRTSYFRSFNNFVRNVQQLLLRRKYATWTEQALCNTTEVCINGAMRLVGLQRVIFLVNAFL